MKNDTIPNQVKNSGTIARVAVQCVCPDTGVEGTFLFTGESHRNPGSRCTPIFDDCAEMFPNLRQNWQQVGHGDLTYTFKPLPTVQNLRVFQTA